MTSRLDDDDAVSAPDEGVEGFEQLADVVEVEASGGLVENEECRIGLLHAQVVGQLDALVFATRESGRRLPQLDVAQAYVLQRDELLDDFLLPSSVSGLKRLPWHDSHSNTRSAMNCISTVMVPSPLHSSQRPPSLLKLK